MCHVSTGMCHVSWVVIFHGSSSHVFSVTSLARTIHVVFLPLLLFSTHTHDHCEERVSVSVFFFFASFRRMPFDGLVIISSCANSVVQTTMEKKAQGAAMLIP